MRPSLAPIERFDGEYRFLSNFWPAVVVFDEMEYQSVEHAYQAAKTLDRALRAKIRTARTAGEAKRIGKNLPLRPQWEELKLPIMEGLLRQKFHDPGLRRLLLATAPRQLVEGNWWGDHFWGVCRGKGQNHLGKLLMKIRDELTPSSSRPWSDPTAR